MRWPQKSRRVHCLGAPIQPRAQSVQQIHRATCTQGQPLCALTSWIKIPRLHLETTGSFSIRACPALTWMLWGRGHRWPFRSPSFFVPLYLGWERGHTGIYLCESAHVGLWEASVHPGTVFDHFVPGHFHQPQLNPFSTCPCLAGRINIVPLGTFFPPQSEGWTAFADPK